MSSLLHKLGSNEAILLMYLADELPREDRTEVERMLSTDSSLRAELERLRGVHEMLASATSADGAMSRASDEMAVRRVLREMKRFQTELTLRPEPAPPDNRAAWPFWTYPIAAAAAALFLFIGLWGVGVIEFDPIPGGGNGIEIAGNPNGELDSDDGGFAMDEPDEFQREQFVLLDEVGEYLEAAAMHVEYLQELEDEDDSLLLMKDPA